VFGLLGIGGKPILIFLILTSGSIFGAYISYYVGKHGLTRIIKIHSNKYQEESTQNYFRKHSILLLLISPMDPGFCQHCSINRRNTELWFKTILVRDLNSEYHQKYRSGLSIDQCN
jgi:molybdenum cofactor biosynthesis enzyme MoaA